MRKFKIDASQVEEFALIGCTLAEMAIVLNCSEESLDRRFRWNIKRGVVRRMVLIRAELFASQMLRGDAAALNGFLHDSVTEQTKDFERRNKEFLSSLTTNEMREALDNYKRCLDYLSSISQSEVSVEERTDEEISGSKLPN
jgi:hypothetical protein